MNCQQMTTKRRDAVCRPIYQVPIIKYVNEGRVFSFRSAIVMSFLLYLETSYEKNVRFVL